MTTSQQPAYGITRTIPGDYEETVERVRVLLKEQGFGVLTEIDVRKTLKEKIGEDVPPQVILGACNPHLASRALEIEPEIGLLLPCNLTVSVREDGTHVGAVNPQSLVDFTSNAALQEVAREADERLRRVIDAL